MWPGGRQGGSYSSAIIEANISKKVGISCFWFGDFL